MTRKSIVRRVALHPSVVATIRECVDVVVADGGIRFDALELVEDGNLPRDVALLFDGRGNLVGTARLDAQDAAGAVGDPPPDLDPPEPVCLLWQATWTACGRGALCGAMSLKPRVTTRREEVTCPDCLARLGREGEIVQ